MISIDQVQVEGLPRRQAEALAYAALGFSAKETARQMAISPRTVETSLMQSMLRLGARNRAHLITRAISAGLLHIREHQLALLACFLFSFASIPLPHHQPADYIRPAVRPVRVRRQDDYLGLFPLEGAL